MKKIVILINDTTYAYNLRGAIIQRLIEANYDVVIVGPSRETKKNGCEINRCSHWTAWEESIRGLESSFAISQNFKK